MQTCKQQKHTDTCSGQTAMQFFCLSNREAEWVIYIIKHFAMSINKSFTGKDLEVS